MSGAQQEYIQISNCRFCYCNIKDKIVAELGMVTAIEDRFPVSEGHMLIIPKNHSHDYFEMTRHEKNDADNLILKLKEVIMKNDPSVTGFNIGVNCGQSAGQTIFHSHVHLNPRRDGDTPNPQGGVRGVIPDRMGY